MFLKDPLLPNEFVMYQDTTYCTTFFGVSIHHLFPNEFVMRLYITRSHDFVMFLHIVLGNFESDTVFTSCAVRTHLTAGANAVCLSRPVQVRTRMGGRRRTERE